RGDALDGGAGEGGRLRHAAPAGCGGPGGTAVPEDSGRNSRVRHRRAGSCPRARGGAAQAVRVPARLSDDARARRSRWSGRAPRGRNGARGAGADRGIRVGRCDRSSGERTVRDARGSRAYARILGPPVRREESAMTAPYRIDVHHHILPGEYVSALAKIGITGGGGIPFPNWSIDGGIGLMDRHGIQAAVTSVSSPGVHFGDAAAARDLARRCNEISARLVTDHPTRFGGFATLPLPDVKGALRELEYALDTLGLDGVVLLASQHDGRVLGDSAFDELFAELERRHPPVFGHPTIPKSSETIPIDIPGFAAEFTFDTSRAILNLVWTGTAERCRNVRLIFSHAGGTAPFLAWRWSLLDHLPGTRERAPRGVVHY